MLLPGALGVCYAFADQDLNSWRIRSVCSTSDRLDHIIKSGVRGMENQENTLVVAELKRIGDLMERALAAQAKRQASLEACSAAELQFRQDAIKGQADLIRTTQKAQRVQQVAMLVVVVAGVIMLAALAGSWYLDHAH